MIEDRSYGKAELAMLYFPTATPRVALNRLVRWINRCPELKQSLCSGLRRQVFPLLHPATSSRNHRISG
ncbi:MAG: DUF4248 domain-containing protein [Segatella copri]